MKIVRANYHDAKCQFKTCVTSGSHYHYIYKFNHPYIEWCTRNRKHLLHGFKIQYGGDLDRIDHKRIKNVEHYNNCIKYIDVYVDIPQEEDEDTEIDDIPNN